VTTPSLAALLAALLTAVLPALLPALQVPAPFVILAQYLPMAVLYDPATLDLSDASVADRLRKQAKTRAVKVSFFFLTDLLFLPVKKKNLAPEILLSLFPPACACLRA
jgi:hypothetical protein